MDVVWIMTQGEDYEGGHIVGVYMDKELAKADFYRHGKEIVEVAENVEQSWGDKTLDVREESDGSLYVHGGCNWLSLAPHEVKSANALES